MTFTSASLLSEDGWVPMTLKGQQENPNYYWWEGGMLADAPVDFAATFAENMFVTTKPIDVAGFNRNPLKVVPNFTVPRHFHNIDETIIVFQGEYLIEYGEDEGKQESVVVKPGNFFTSRAGTPYTMTSGPEGVTYIETWGVPVRSLRTVWHQRGWVPR
jgi:mannose-6-phosphate isomerase-like protein (cupin superfamily)